MFPLTRPVRQILATIGLVALTIAPTLYVATTAWKIRSPGHLRELEVEIGRQLGLQVSIEGVRYPQPGEVLYKGIVFRQEEPRRRGLREIARASSMRLHRVDRELLLESQGLRLTGESPKLSMASVAALLQRPTTGNYERVSLTAPTCELDLGSEGIRYDFREVVATFQADQMGPTLRGSYRVASLSASSSRAEFAVTRDRSHEPVRTSITLKTAEGPALPCRMLNPFFNAEEWLGPKARVEGTLSLQQAAGNEWEATFQGDLLDIDLGTLVGRRFPSHRLSGLAHVTIKNAHWGERPGQGMGWIDVSGGLTTHQGSIGVELLASLEKEMKFRIADRVKHTTLRKPEVEFGAMGLTFDIERNGEIQIGGALGNEYAPEVVLTSQEGPMAAGPRGAANVRGLIKTLFPVSATNTGIMVPLTAESRLLLCLPTPPNMAPQRLEGN